MLPAAAGPEEGERADRARDPRSRPRRTCGVRAAGAAAVPGRASLGVRSAGRSRHPAAGARIQQSLARTGCALIAPTRHLIAAPASTTFGARIDAAAITGRSENDRLSDARCKAVGAIRGADLRSAHVQTSAPICRRHGRIHGGPGRGRRTERGCRRHLRERDRKAEHDAVPDQRSAAWPRVAGAATERKALAGGAGALAGHGQGALFSRTPRPRD